MKNFVSNKDESSPKFKNPVLEYLFSTHWSSVLYIFIPVVLFLLFRSFYSFHENITTIVLLFLTGAVSWTLAEYIMHRFLYHLTLPGEWGKKFHYIIHGVHHDYPSDSKRALVPAVTIPIAILFYALFCLLMGSRYCAPFYAGFVLFYIFYDLTHYAIHHANFKNPIWLKIKQNHIRHHYLDSTKAYGVTTPFWDYVFGTTIDKKEPKNQKNALT